MKTSKLLLALTAAHLATACADRDRPKGGGTVEPGFDRHGLYVANTDHDTLSRIDLRTGDVQTFALGKEPTRIGRAGKRVYVTNRAARSVSVLEDDGVSMVEVGTIATGAEPFGVVATANRVYVSASIQGKVFEYDAASFAELRSWEVSGEPRGLALHRSGYALYVASTYSGRYTVIDLRNGIARELDLPRVTGFDFNTGTELDLARRITGDPAVSPDGLHLGLPVLYVDNVSVIPDDPKEGEGEARAPGGGGGYGGRFNPGIVDVELEPDTGEIHPDTAVAYAVQGGFMREDGLFFSANGYPVSLTYTPDSEIGLVAVEGANVVHAIDFQQAQSFAGGGADKAAPAPGIPGGGAGMMFLPITTITTGAAPVGVAVLNDDVAYVHVLFDARVQRIDLAQVRSVLRPNSNAGIAVPVGAPDRGFEPMQVRAGDGFALGGDVLESNVARGRRLFFTTGNPMMSGEGSGVSCATCHFQGRTDGLTWRFERGLRNTPSLAGEVSRYEPVGWTGDRPTVAEDAMLTSQGLMGGQGLTVADTLDIAAFIDHGREIDNPLRAANDEGVARGAAIFARADVGCIGCHNGPAYTNNTNVPMFELDSVKVRPLNGIRASAPYFHDGSAATLRDVLERARTGSMGNTSTLSNDEMADLEKYLLSL